MSASTKASEKLVVGISKPELSKIAKENASGVGPGATWVVRFTSKLKLWPAINGWKNSLKNVLSIKVTVPNKSPEAPPIRVGLPEALPPPKLK
jgi:hypothetical protein